MEPPMVPYTENVVGELISEHAMIRVGSYRWPLAPVIRADEPHVVTWIDRPGAGEFDAEVTLRDGRVVRAPFGAVSFRPAGSSIVVESNGSASHSMFVSCWIDPDYVSEAFAMCDDFSGSATARGFNLKSARVKDLLRRLGAEARAPGFAHGLLIESGSAMLGVEVARTIGAYSGARTHGPARLAPWQLARIRDRAYSADASVISAAELAALCRISTGHLRRAFKATTGQTVHDYVSSIVSDRAAHLLVTSSDTIDSIARTLGFKSLSGFNSAFQRKFGVSPGAYRRNARADGSQREIKGRCR